MASYMFLFTLAVALFLSDARPYNPGWSDMTNTMNDDFLTEISRLLNEQEHRERQLPALKQRPDFALWTYQLRKFRHHSTNINEQVKRSLKEDEYNLPPHAVEYNDDFLELM